MKKDEIQKALKRLGENIRRERAKAKFTQEKLAELSNLNRRTIQKIEAGQTNILITTAQRIQKALNCKWDSLMK